MPEATPPQRITPLSVRVGFGNQPLEPDVASLQPAPLVCQTDPKIRVCLEPHHCPVCGKHYLIQIFRHPGPCCIVCDKEQKNDHWPSRSPLVREK